MSTELNENQQQAMSTESNPSFLNQLSFSWKTGLYVALIAVAVVVVALLIYDPMQKQHHLKDVVSEKQLTLKAISSSESVDIRSELDMDASMVLIQPLEDRNGKYMTVTLYLKSKGDTQFMNQSEKVSVHFGSDSTSMVSIAISVVDETQTIAGTSEKVRHKDLDKQAVTW
eukprot:CAMPEP_0175090196 /NCGR_PEP_ID=MMETSP0086_2-20121207/1200_1 /TAXON_ID=136419 /ORGANISM="Unknown Unknown, Strain D1" /LENGTH=170 /DNA_ID=CAMNT_0016362775 /DNA_START=255 /DNA_END=764 /DNA_ORIENTATION=-